LTDEFLHAVDHETFYNLQFPVDSDKPQVEFTIKAKEIWDKIIDAAWTSAEPGIMFWDTILRESPADCYSKHGFKTVGTNPCSELPLSANDSCRLLLLNTCRFVRAPFTPESEFDWAKFAITAQKAQRMMDNLVDIEIEQIDKILAKVMSDPEPEHIKAAEIQLWTLIRKKAVTGRRTGLGVTALGDAVAYLNMRYGSDQSIEFIERVYKVLAINAYKSSCLLAKERGCFPLYDPHLECDNVFLKRLFAADTELADMHKKYGRRNIAILTTAPAGSVSTLTQTTSGIEPVYMLEYKRRKKISQDNEQAKIDFVDTSGDKWQEFIVYHHGLQRWITVTGESDIKKSPYWGATAQELDWKQRVILQSRAQRWVDHAISSTVNVPTTATRDDISTIYLTAWKYGCKGITVYRDGCRTGVLVSNKSEIIAPEDFVNHQAPKRPVELPCDIKFTRVKGEDWVVLVGLMNGRPYEVMGGKTELVEIPKTCTDGLLVKNSRKTVPSRYDLKLGKNGHSVYLKNIVKLFDNPEHSAFTRVISLALRHGADIKFVVEQLMKDKDSDMFSFAKSISRALKTYIKDGEQATDKTCFACGKEGLVYMEGCLSCKICGISKCA